MVVDANGQALAYVYFEDEPGRRAAAKLLTRDEARRIAADIPSCPVFLQPPRFLGNRVRSVRGLSQAELASRPVQVC
jgi:hypothetical protein